MSELVDKQKIIHEAERLANDFKACDGGSTCFRIDGHEYHTDTGYAIDGIDAYVEVFTERINALQPAQPEIIRCKDCKHRPIKIYDGIVPPKEDDWKCPCLCDDYFYSWIPEDNFFCANAERREE